MKRPPCNPTALRRGVPSANRRIAATAERIEAALRSRGIHLTMGGEPSFLPVQPDGPEWSVAALGPTKLRYARAFCSAIMQSGLEDALPILSPGKVYPGEVNPRWALHLVVPRDGGSLWPRSSNTRPASALDLPVLRAAVSEALDVGDFWHKAGDLVWVLPLDHDGTRFRSGAWSRRKDRAISLIEAAGPAGLRLPLSGLRPDAIRRALVLEFLEDGLHIFLPPFLQPYWEQLLASLCTVFSRKRIERPFLDGYLPKDENTTWNVLSFTPDPGVIEVNLPPCPTWREYHRWLVILGNAAASSGLAMHQLSPDGHQIGTGGGNHLLFGGPDPERHPFFTRPAWLASVLRYWQHHPCFSYLFTGQYVGSSSQAPRPDESSRDLYDLEMAYRYLEELPDGQDWRVVLGETLRHLHTDASGNTHRSEISFDKFWSPSWQGGCRGLIEFRALESLPDADWSSAVALLWRAVITRLSLHPFREPLRNFGSELHDRYFLPSYLWMDLEAVLRDIETVGFPLPHPVFRRIWEWRFPLLLRTRLGGATLTVRKACESWPLLCETPIEGGSTSRFVDTSIERLEFRVDGGTGDVLPEISVQGRPLPLDPLPLGGVGAGLRYRRSALYPCLHPGIPVQFPLWIQIGTGAHFRAFRLGPDSPVFEATCHNPPPRGRPLRALRPGFMTRDLRIES